MALKGQVAMAHRERWRGFAELPPDLERRLTRLVPLLQKRGVALAYLFGSLTHTGKANDVDLAVLVPGGGAYRLRPEIADCLGTERLDLVDLSHAPPALRFEIVRTGRVLYEADPEMRERFEMDTLRLYRDTNHLRRRQAEYLTRRFAEWRSKEKRSSSA